MATTKKAPTKKTVSKKATATAKKATTTAKRTATKATSTAKKATAKATKEINSTRKNTKKAVMNFHDNLITNTTDIVDGTVKAGEKWQKVMANAIKKSEPVRTKQVDMIFDTAEAVKTQINYSTTRIKALVGWEDINLDEAKAKITNNKYIKRLKADVEEIVDEVSDNPIVKNATKTAKKVTNKATKTARKTATKVKVEVQDAVDEVKDEINEAIASLSKGVKNNDLKIIDGVGPKLESVLKDAGIKSFADLSKKSEKELKEILTSAGPRYRMHNPSDWKEQAELAAAGKFEALASWLKNKKATV